MSIKTRVVVVDDSALARGLLAEIIDRQSDMCCVGAASDPLVAREMIRIIDIDRLQSAYRVRRAANGGGLEWLGFDDDREMVLDEEPDSSAWLRLKLLLLAPFIPESLL